MVRTVTTAAAVAALLALASACASGSSSKAEQEPAQAQAQAEPAAPRGVAPPAGSPLAQVQLGMNDGEVRRIMGEPTSQNAYITGKSFIPYYYGTDTSRTDYKYKGIGRVVFSRNQYSGNLKVIRIDYDPSEQGY
jgi:hypothetical protein